MRANKLSNNKNKTTALEWTAVEAIVERGGG